ncbi:hypothetical protein EJ07DRAFT_32862, partial [Lizonia empirigonia]
ITERKTRKRKYIQQGGTIEYGQAASQGKEQPNQLYGAVETVVGLGTTLARAKRIQKRILN